MTYHQAADLLDQRKAGADMPEAVITRALELTGDLDQSYTVRDAVAELSHE